jgi:hypothetical protein
MTEADNAQWAADTERLLIAGLSATGQTPLDFDTETVDTVRQRCVLRYGEQLGMSYYQTLVATLPDRRPELFPELAEFQG